MKRGKQIKALKDGNWYWFVIDDVIGVPMTEKAFEDFVDQCFNQILKSKTDYSVSNILSQDIFGRKVAAQ